MIKETTVITLCVALVVCLFVVWLLWFSSPNEKTYRAPGHGSDGNEMIYRVPGRGEDREGGLWDRSIHAWVYDISQRPPEPSDINVPIVSANGRQKSDKSKQPDKQKNSLH
ncbi:MAG: hypothetical protein HOP23_16365 [Methylococcaceae bacterium]|nr:hypothetical protein [Methylococcaceae bacterium]